MRAESNSLRDTTPPEIVAVFPTIDSVSPIPTMMLDSLVPLTFPRTVKRLEVMGTVRRYGHHLRLSVHLLRYVDREDRLTQLVENIQLASVVSRDADAQAHESVFGDIQTVNITISIGLEEDLDEPGKHRPVHHDTHSLPPLR
jgi:hypothetical protein